MYTKKKNKHTESLTNDIVKLTLLGTTGPKPFQICHILSNHHIYIIYIFLFCFFLWGGGGGQKLKLTFATAFLVLLPDIVL